MTTLLEQQNIKSEAMEKGNSRLILGLLLALSLGVLSLGVDRPLLGNFSGRSIPYADVARNWAEGYASWTLPTSNILVKGKPTLMMLDFPLISYLAAFLNRASAIPVDICGRVISIVAAITAMYLLIGIVRRLLSVEVALWTGFFFALSPLTIIYGQSFQADMLAVCLSLGSIAVFQRRFAQGGGWLAMVVCGVLFGLAMATRPSALCTGTMLLALAWSSKGKRVLLDPRIYVVGLVAVLIPYAWYSYAVWVTRQYDNVIWSVLYQADSKFLHLNAPFVNFFQTMAVTTGAMILNPLGLLLLLAGFVGLRRDVAPVALWLGVAVAMLLSMPQKIYDHNYYLLVLVPMASLFAARGVLRAKGWKCFSSKIAKGIFFFITFVLSMGVAWGPAFVTPRSEGTTVALAEEIKNRTMPGDSIIFATRSSSVMYYAKRKGWHMQLDRPHLPPILVENARLHDTPAVMASLRESFQTPMGIVEYYHAQGACYLAITQTKELEGDAELRAWLEENHMLVQESPALVLYKLLP
jgi:hypothetical protein